MYNYKIKTHLISSFICRWILRIAQFEVSNVSWNIIVHAQWSASTLQWSLVIKSWVSNVYKWLTASWRLGFYESLGIFYTKTTTYYWPAAGRSGCGAWPRSRAFLPVPGSHSRARRLQRPTTLYSFCGTPVVSLPLLNRSAINNKKL